MKKNLLLVLLLVSAYTAFSQAFLPNNLLVTRIGQDTTETVSGTYTTIFLDEHSTTTGQLIKTHTVKNLVGDGTINEGYFQVSPNGKFLAVGGYDKKVGEIRTIDTFNTGDRAKVILFGSEGVDKPLQTYLLPAGVYSNNTPGIITTRLTGTVASNDGLSFYAGGGTRATSSGGIFYVTGGSNPSFTSVQTTQANLRVPMIHGNQLFVSGNAGTLGNAAAIRVGAVTPTLPTAAGGRIVNFKGANFSASFANGGIPLGVYQFSVIDADMTIDGDDILYTSDDGLGQTVNGALKGGIKKFKKNSAGDWGLVFEVFSGTDRQDTLNFKIRGLASIVKGQNIELYATAFDPIERRYKILKMIENNFSNNVVKPTWTTIYTSKQGETIKGITFTPGSLTTSTNDIASEFENIKVYPNPTSEKVTIIHNDLNQPATLNIISLNGQIVKSLDVNLDSNTTDVSLSDVPQGVYQIQLITASNIFSQKLIKN